VKLQVWIQGAVYTKEDRTINGGNMTDMCLPRSDWQNQVGVAYVMAISSDATRRVMAILLFLMLGLVCTNALAKVSENVTPPGDHDVVERPAVQSEQPAAQSEASKPELEVKGAVALGSDIRVRGLSFTDGGTSVVGMVHLDYNSFYAVVIGMNADLGSVIDTEGHSQSLVGSALITALGYKTKLGGAELDVGATFYAFPGAFDNQDFLVHGPILGLPREIPLGRAHFFEVHVGVGGKPWKTMQATFTVNWTPEYLYETGQNWAFEGNFKQLLWHGSQISLLGVGQLGYNTGDFLDYWYYNVGLTMVYKHHYVFDLRYNNTFDFELDCSLTKLCGGTVVFRGAILF
jgi:hypothetical protein